jgi:trehalose utilization protein
VANGGDPWSDGPDLIDACDGVVLFLSQGGQWMRTNPDRHAALERLALRRGGIVALHWAVGAKDAAFIDTSLRFIGACHGGPDRKYVKRDARVHVVQGHPIARGLGEWDVHDEFYYQLKRTLAEPGIEPILTTVIEGNEETAAWAWQRPDGGRSFGFVGLHFHRNWELEEYRRMVVQGVLWTLEVPIPAEGMKVDCPPELLALPAREKGASKVTR